VTDRGVFSPQRIDRGTRLLIRTVELPPGARFADWGCGYGAVGVRLAARDPSAWGWLVDVNRRAVRLTGRNVRGNGIGNAQVVLSDGLTAFRAGKVLDAVVSNPPIRAGRALLRRLLVESRERLRSSGHLWLVVRTQQGARSLARDMKELVGPVDTVARGGGYRVLRSTCLP
jgi:16S rRNA (guanine1207-N2)-methyltransferase